MTDTIASHGFGHFGLLSDIQKNLDAMGWQSPTPVQDAAIPLLLEGRDVAAQAQTGTGKTAAFALPLLSRLDVADRRTQVLVLTPTRELAVQTAEACELLASGMAGVHVQPVCGGREYGAQIHGLKRGAHIVVGTPGRIMDHLRKGTFQTAGLRAIVLDEADEMLRMGFIEDVEWILSQLPEEHQTALFSATMAPRIRRIAERYLNDPAKVSIETSSPAAETISQFVCTVSHKQKPEALMRILEAEAEDGVIVFVRTKADSVTLSETLTARGFKAAALNGDLPQNLRERTVDQLRRGVTDILTATDVAARGLDVERIGLVINYDPPHDTDSYIHRIGRTGRAGRSGKAILLLSPTERRMVRQLERAAEQRIQPLTLPSAKRLNKLRAERFAARIETSLSAGGPIDEYRTLLSDITEANPELSPLDAAAALAMLLQDGRSLFLEDLPMEAPKRVKRPDDRGFEGKRAGRGADRKNAGVAAERKGGKRPGRPPRTRMEAGMERFRVQVGSSHGLTPSNLVGAIANEANLSSRHIGRIDIFDAHATVDLPEGMPSEVFHLLRNVRVCNRKLNIRRHA